MRCAGVDNTQVRNKELLLHLYSHDESPESLGRTRELLAAKASPDMRDTLYGNRPVAHMAIECGRVDTLRLLLESKCQAWANRVPDTRNTVFHSAAARRDPACLMSPDMTAMRASLSRAAPRTAQPLYKLLQYGLRAVQSHRSQPILSLQYYCVLRFGPCRARRAYFESYIPW